MALRECQTYIQAIRNYLGDEPDGALLDIKALLHDLGTYYQVVCYYDIDKPESIDYAFRCERQAPQTWEEGSVKPPPRASERKLGLG